MQSRTHLTLEKDAPISRPATPGGDGTDRGDHHGRDDHQAIRTARRSSSHNEARGRTPLPINPRDMRMFRSNRGGASTGAFKYLPSTRMKWARKGEDLTKDPLSKLLRGLAPGAGLAHIRGEPNGAA